MHFAVIDDDKLFSEKLNRYISDFCNGQSLPFSVDLISPEAFPSCEESLINYNVIFLDIEMPGTNGILLADKINKLRGNNTFPYIVFVTSQDHLVFDALKQFPYAFIRKSKIYEIDSCLQNLSKKLLNSPTYSIKDGRWLRSVEIKNIIRLEKNGNYTVFHTTEGIYQERSSISDKQKELSAYHFLKPHSGSLINAEYIKEYKNEFVLMTDGTRLTVSRNFKKAFKSDLHKWIKE